MKKHLFTLLFALAGIATQVSAFEVGGLWYEPTGEVDLLVGQATCIVRGFASNNKNSTELSIPNLVIDGETGTPYWPIAIGANAFKGSNVSTILSLGTIQEIGSYAFYNTRIMGDLSSITVMKVGEFAFYSCNLLTSVEFAACTEIGNSAFAECGILFSASFPLVQKIGDYAFYKCGELLHFELPITLTSLGRYAFAECVDMDEVVNMGVVSLKTIPYACFQHCEDLRSFHFTSCITKIEDYAFDGCLSIEKVSLPEEVESVGYFAFRGCRDLTTVYIKGPNTQLSLGQPPFKDCENIRSVRIYGTETSAPFVRIFPDCKNSLDTVAFFEGSTCVGKEYAYGSYQPEFDGYTKLSTVDIREGVTLIGAMAFYNCPSLRQIALPESLTAILGSAFEGSGLESIVIPNNVKRLGSSAFKDCKNLQSITWSNNLTELPWNVCFGCQALQELSLPASITSIGRYAFRGCEALTSVSIPGRQTSWENEYFSGCPNIKKASLICDEKTPRLSVLFGDSKETLETMRLYPGSTCLGTVDTKGGRVFSYSTLQDFGKLSKVIIPEGVHMIGYQAFANDTLLTDVSLPSTIDTIGEGAFMGTNIGKIVIPRKITAINATTFKNCKNLNDVQYSNSLQTIGTEAFYNCTSLDAISLPFSVTEIGLRAFEGCSAATYITIGDKVKSIKDNAFSHCSNVDYITCHIVEPLTNISSSSYSPFYGIDRATTYLYVPAGSVDDYQNQFAWSGFKYIYPIGTDYVETEEILTIRPTETEVTITWMENADADLYYIAIYDKTRNIKICDFYFDYLGDLIEMDYPVNAGSPRRAPQRQAADGLSWTINGLDAGETYTYWFFGYNDTTKEKLDERIAQFTTKAVPTGTEEVQHDETQSTKMLMDGQIRIRRGGHTYDLQGKTIL